MGTLNLAIISEDREYAEALAWAIVRNSKGTEIWVYNDPEHVEADVSFDAILMDVEESKLAVYLIKNESQSPSENNSYTKINESQCLSRKKSYAGNNGQDVDIVLRFASGGVILNKYDNVRNLIKKIFDLCGRTDESQSIDESLSADKCSLSDKNSYERLSADVMNEKDIFCFVSERGGSGCSKLSRTFAEEQGLYNGKKVLYFSLDQFPEYPSGEDRQNNAVDEAGPDHYTKKADERLINPKSGMITPKSRMKNPKSGIVRTKSGFAKNLKSAGNQTIGSHMIGNQTIGNQTIGNQTIGNHMIGNQTIENQTIEDTQKSLKEYLYRLLKNKNSNNVLISENGSGNARSSKISAYLQKDENGVMFFKAGEGVNPLLELDEKEYLFFMRSVMEAGGYDIIVIDCGNQVSMQMIRSMELSRRIFLVKDGRPENLNWRKCVGYLLDDENRRKVVLTGQ